jgi:hypothetical protein
MYYHEGSIAVRGKQVRVLRGRLRDTVLCGSSTAMDTLPEAPQGCTRDRFVHLRVGAYQR